MHISVVIPLFNEQESLEELYTELTSVAHAGSHTFEMIFVDDGSSDDSWSIIKSICDRDPTVKAVQFRRNFGKAAAIKAGVAEAAHEIIVTIDADLQDNPAELPKLLSKLDEGWDVVSGWKSNRKDPLGKRLPSKMFNWLVGLLTRVKLKDHNCGFKVYRREVFDEVNLYGEMHRFVPVLAASRGFKVTEVSVHHRKRKYGKSKYGASRLLKGFLDLLTVFFLTGFSHRPQHLMGTLGLLSFLGGVVGLITLSIQWVLTQYFEFDLAPLHQRPLLIFSIGFLLLGAQLLTIGFLAELIVAFRSETHRTFSIKNRINH
jgi:glycosyltransferase involved in cell wall biosynthesis